MEQNGQGWKPPYTPMTIPELIQRIHDANYPKEVVLPFVDFAAMGKFIPCSRDEQGRIFFWWLNTKVMTLEAREDTLDLSDFRGNRIVSPS